MKKIWILSILGCLSLSVFAQDSKIKAGFVLMKAKQSSFKNLDSIEKIFIESDSKYKTRTALLKKGYISSFEYKTELWLQSPTLVKLKTLTDYSGGSFELRERTNIDEKLGLSIKVKYPGGDRFIPFGLQIPGNQKRNEEIQLNEVKYESFCLSFPIYLFPNQNLKFDYLGLAKSDEQMADVIATTIADTYKINMFFDQKTHRLLLMNAKFIDPKSAEEIEHKYFFSDYKESNGVTFAHKVVIHENGEIIEERIIKQIKLNPQLDADFFKLTK